MFCPKCGNQISEGIKFCPKCGNAFENAEEGTIASTGTQPEGERKKEKKLGKRGRIILALAGSVAFIAVIGIVVWWVNPEGRLNRKIEAAKKSGATSLDLSSFDASGMTDMYGMFANCANLEELDLSGFDTSSVDNMSGMFYGCASLEELDLSGFDTSNVEGMGFMFFNCNSMEELDLGSFDTSSVTDMKCMFFGCSSLKELDLSNFDTSSVGKGNTGRLYRKLMKRLKRLNGGMPISMKIATGSMDGMFLDCNSLEELDLSGFDTSSVTDMNSMFNGCNSLKELDLSSFDTSSVEIMYGMFDGCSRLEELDLSSFDTSSVTDMEWMFAGCRNLKELDLSSFDTSSVTDMGLMFNNCSGLGTVYLGEGWTDKWIEYVKDTYPDINFIMK